MTLSLRAQAEKALAPYLGAAREDEWARRVRVILADGRVAVPAERRYESIPDGGYPPDYFVWDSIAEFSRSNLMHREDGKPPSAELYQRQALLCQTKLLAMLMGKGSGKTTIGDFKLTEAALLNPGGISILGFPSSKTPWLNTIPMFNTQVPKFEAYLPAKAIRVPKRRSAQGYYGRVNQYGFYEILWRNNHRTIVLTVDYSSGAYRRVEGPDACFAWLDEAEQMHPKAIKTIVTRLRDDRGMLMQMLITTSLGDPGFLEQLFVGDDVDRSIFEVIRASTKEATFRGPAYLAMLEKVLTKDEFRRQVESEIFYTEGLVYDDLLSPKLDHPTWLPTQPTSRTHAWLPSWPGWAPSTSLPVSIGVDFGDTRSSAVISQECMVQGEMCDIVFDEVILPIGSAHQLSQVLKERLKPYKTLEIFTDYSTTSEPDRRTMRKILKGASVRAAVNEVNSRHYRVLQGVRLVQALCRDHEGRRHLYIADTLHGSITRGPDMAGLREAFGLYRWPAHKNRIHILDALRYLCLGKRGPKGIVEGA